MIRTKIHKDITVNTPPPVRSTLSVGQEIAITSDAQGRLVITPVQQVQPRLMETFGMWAGRTDLPDDDLDRVDELRRGHRSQHPCSLSATRS